MQSQNPNTIDITTVGEISVDSITIAKYVTISGVSNPLTEGNLYVIGSKTLASNFIVDVNEDSFKTGDTIGIWFRCTMTPAGHSVLICSNNFTTIVATGSAVNVVVTLKFSGSAWYVDSVDKQIQTALDAYIPDVTSVAGKTGAVTLVKADVGLGSVENTALSTWTGSSTITTLGTIVSGVWHGTAIADGYIASAAAWNAKAPLASPTFTGTPSAPTAALSTSTTQLATTQFVQSSINNYQLIAWGATIDLTGLVSAAKNTVVIDSITANTVINADVFDGNVSEIDFILPFSGAFTVTAGTNMSFDTITGVSTHRTVLTVIWDVVAEAYIQKSFSQN